MITLTTILPNLKLWETLRWHDLVFDSYLNPPPPFLSNWKLRRAQHCTSRSLSLSITQVTFTEFKLLNLDTHKHKSSSSLARCNILGISSYAILFILMNIWNEKADLMKAEKRIHPSSHVSMWRAHTALSWALTADVEQRGGEGERHSRSVGGRERGSGCGPERKTTKITLCTSWTSR